MIARLLGAVQYLTVLPPRQPKAEPGASAFFFPLVGAALGACGGAVLEASLGYVPFTLVCLLVLVFWTVITGGLHESGLAMAADPSENSRIGAAGALALLVLMLIRWQALSSIAVPAIPALAAALALGRAAVVMLAWIAPPAGSENAIQFSAALTSRVAIAVLLQGILFAMLPGGRVASVLLGGSTALVLMARAYFTRRFGGVNQASTGATEQIVETFCFVVYTCRPCIS
jgi:adenosylcobinamide-GDP ribazoletransferase